MNSRNLVTLILMTLLMSLSLVTSVQAGKDKPKPASEKEILVKEGLDEANAEAQEEIRDNTRARRNANRDVVVDEGVDVVRDQHGEITDAASDRMDAQESRKRADAELKGNERAQEMRARRDERKAIKEEYKSDRNAGQESASGLVPEVKSEEVAEEAEAAEETKEKAKKPWWKLWQD